MADWIPTRAEGLNRLDRFLPYAGHHYASQRNYDRGRGHHDAVSTLSPWIRHRLLVEEDVVKAVIERHSRSAADKFIQEVCWRTYWKGWLELRPGVWHEYRARMRGLADELEKDTELRRAWENAVQGRTAIECFDSWSSELVETGYLHNHARMWFASIWVFTLGLPWELGADFFLRHLLDGDPASNTLSWRWVCGLQTRGKTYLARPGNIARYTEGRFRPGDSLASEAPPTASPPSVPRAMAPPDPALPDPTLRSGLLLTEEDLSPEFLSRGPWQIESAAAMIATAGRSPLAVSPRVAHFAEGALRDALGRVGGTRLFPVAGPGEEQDIGRIVEWARDNELEQIITPYIPVGPTAEITGPLTRALAIHGTRFVAVLRDWDRLAWPHATRGFFAFRKQIPGLLRRVLATDASVA